MDINVILVRSTVFVSVLVRDPATGVILDPTAGSVAFYQVNTSGEIAQHPMGVTALAKINNIDGFWGAAVDISDYIVAPMLAGSETIVPNQTIALVRLTVEGQQMGYVRPILGGLTAPSFRQGA